LGKVLVKVISVKGFENWWRTHSAEREFTSKREVKNARRGIDNGEEKLEETTDTLN